MASALQAAAGAAGLFAVTNVDDLVVLTALFRARDRAAGRGRGRSGWGSTWSLGLLVAVSAAAAMGLEVVPDRYVRWLGLVPLALGVRGCGPRVPGRRRRRRWWPGTCWKSRA